MVAVKLNAFLSMLLLAHFAVSEETRNRLREADSAWQAVRHMQRILRNPIARTRESIQGKLIVKVSWYNIVRCLVFLKLNSTILHIMEESSSAGIGTIKWQRINFTS